MSTSCTCKKCLLCCFLPLLFGFFLTPSFLYLQTFSLYKFFLQNGLSPSKDENTLKVFSKTFLNLPQVSFKSLAQYEPLRPYLYRNLVSMRHPRFDATRKTRQNNKNELGVRTTRVDLRGIRCRMVVCSSIYVEFPGQGSSYAYVSSGEFW